MRVQYFKPVKPSDVYIHHWPESSAVEVICFVAHKIPYHDLTNCFLLDSNIWMCWDSVFDYMGIDSQLHGIVMWRMPLIQTDMIWMNIDRKKTFVSFIVVNDDTMDLMSAWDIWGHSPHNLLFPLKKIPFSIHLYNVIVNQPHVSGMKGIITTTDIPSCQEHINMPVWSNIPSNIQNILWLQIHIHVHHLYA